MSPKCRWNEAMEDELLDFLLCEMELGKQPGGISKRRSNINWKITEPIINAPTILPQGWPRVPARKIRHKYDHMRQDFLCFQQMKNDLSDLGWDMEKQISTCDDKTWQEYLQAHSSRVAKFRRKTLRNYDSLIVLFSHDFIATQELSSPSDGASKVDYINNATAPDSENIIVTANKCQNSSVGSDYNPGGNSSTSTQEIDSSRVGLLITRSPTVLPEDFGPPFKRQKKSHDNTQKPIDSSTSTSAIAVVASKSVAIDLTARFYAIKAVQNSRKSLCLENTHYLARAYRVFKSLSKAEMFLAMGDDEARTEWLHYEIDSL